MQSIEISLRATSQCSFFVSKNKQRKELIYMVKNKNLNDSKKRKNDEFYTLLPDIETELQHYKNRFRGKIIYCNCDNPEFSNFWKYFQIHFKEFGIRKLIATYYDSGKPTYKYVLSSGNDKPTKTPLTGDGDFRSDECINILKEADIVVTNPPFSLFREYVAQLIKYDKRFIIIGSLNAVGYKDIFPLIKEGAIQISSNNQHQLFRIPDDYDIGVTKVDSDGHKYATIGNIAWYTNLPTIRKLKDLILTKSYSPDKYPHYDNYDAINVNKLSEIPCDYDGVMGVPVTFIAKYNPEQFKILGITTGSDAFEAAPTKKYINPVRMTGTHKGGSSTNTSAVLLLTEPQTDGTYYTADNVDGFLKVLYKRILIQKNKP